MNLIRSKAFVRFGLNGWIVCAALCSPIRAQEVASPKPLEVPSEASAPSAPAKEGAASNPAVTKPEPDATPNPADTKPEPDATLNPADTKPKPDATPNPADTTPQPDGVTPKPVIAPNPRIFPDPNTQPNQVNPTSDKLDFKGAFLDALKSPEVKSEFQTILNVKKIEADIKSLKASQDQLRRDQTKLRLQLNARANIASATSARLTPPIPVTSFSSLFPRRTANAAASARAAASSNPTPAATKVHVILALHTGDRLADGINPNGIRFGARKTVPRLRDLFRHQTTNVPGNPQPIVLQDAAFNHAEILRQIQLLRTTNTAQELAQQTVVLWIGCHGATDEVTGQHVLEIPTPNGRQLVVRTTYLNELRAIGARQTVMITDTCSNIVRLNVPPVGIQAAASRPATHLLSKLLLHQTGVFDFSGSTVPEFGAYHPDRGSLFSEAFYNASLFADGVQESQGWKGLLDACQTRMNDPIVFEDNTTQQGQHPVPFPVFRTN